MANSMLDQKEREGLKALVSLSWAHDDIIKYNKRVIWRKWDEGGVLA